MNNRDVRRVVVFGAFAIAGIIALQAYWVSKSWSQAERSFDQNVKIALLRVARSMAEFNEIIIPSTNLVKRMNSNYYVVNFNNVIDANILEYYLLKEFEALSINLPFEYAIYDCSSDEMVYGNLCSTVEHEIKDKGDHNLPKYDEFLYYFGIKFPSRSSVLFSDIWLSILFSVITLSALVFFAYSIFIMLNQKRLSELQRDFINNMTHEFKTPISSIKISSELFSNHPTIKKDDRLLQYAQIIHTQNERLNQQVEKVLNIARIGSDNFELNKEPIDLNKLVKEIGVSKEPEISHLGGTLDYELQTGMKEVSADTLHLGNVILNLIDNAIKYSEGAPRITVRTSEKTNKHELWVSDEGIGIAKDQQKHLFKKFYRVPTGNIHNVKGFGLGLHYVKRIIDMHGWQIDVESNKEKGTIMKIIIFK